MRATELFESAASELAKKLPSLEKHDYNTIDKLMRKIASNHRITGKALHDLFVKKYQPRIVGLKVNLMRVKI
mgnify:CR=1 FL=1